MTYCGRQVQHPGQKWLLGQRSKRTCEPITAVNRQYLLPRMAACLARHRPSAKYKWHLKSPAGQHLYEFNSAQPLGITILLSILFLIFSSRQHGFGIKAFCIRSSEWYDFIPFQSWLPHACQYAGVGELHLDYLDDRESSSQDTITPPAMGFPCRIHTVSLPS